MNEYLSTPSASEEKRPEEKKSVPVSPAPDMRAALKSRCATGRGAALTLCAFFLAMLFCDGVLLSSAGISMPLCTLGYQALVWMIFRTHPDWESRRMRRARRLAIPILILPLGHLLHYNPSTRWVATLTLFVLCALQLAVFSGADSPFSLTALRALPERLIVSPLVSLDLPFAALGALRNTRSASMRRAAAAALGVVLALPVGIILLALFAHADALFADALSRFFQALHLNFFALYLDLIFGGLGGLFCAAGLLGARYDVPDEPKPAAERWRAPSIVCCAFLSVVDLITALFVAFQFVYLFGGESTRAVYEMTYAEYARRGFFELCAASGMVFAVSLLALLLSRPSKAVRVLTAILAACDLVVLASAVRRMLLYVDVYGLSVRRLLTLWGMAVVAVCLVLLLIRCVRERFDVVRFLSLTAVTGVCILSLANTDGLAAAWNLRAIAQGTLDTTSLRGLSYSAAAIVAREGYGEDVLHPMCVQLKERHPLYSFCLDDIAARLAFERTEGNA